MQLNLCSGSVIPLTTLLTVCSISLQEKAPLFILVWNNQRPLLSQPADSLANGHDVQLRINEERGGDWVETLNSNHFLRRLVNELHHLAPRMDLKHRHVFIFIPGVEGWMQRELRCLRPTCSFVLTDVGFSFTQSNPNKDSWLLWLLSTAG